MLEYERIDISEGIDVNKTNLSKKVYMSKRKAKILMTNSNSIDRKGSL